MDVIGRLHLLGGRAGRRRYRVECVTFGVFMVHMACVLTTSYWKYFRFAVESIRERGSPNDVIVCCTWCYWYSENDLRAPNTLLEAGSISGEICV